MEINTNRQNQALVILTIGTAVLGVGLFQVDFSVGNAFFDLSAYVRFNESFSVADFFAIIKLVPAGLVVGHYFTMFRHVIRIMRDNDDIPGSQLANGPLRHLGIEIWFLIMIFVIDVAQKSAIASQ